MEGTEPGPLKRPANAKKAAPFGTAFGVASVADVFAPLFYGEDFRYSGTLMAPLSFTLIMIGFANVIRTQVVLPQERDSIFVKSVCCGAVVNLVKPVEELFADFYRERNGGVEAGDKDLGLMAFAGEMTRRAAAAGGEPGEEDFRKILDFVMEQEGGRA